VRYSLFAKDNSRGEKTVIDLTIHAESLGRAVQRAKEKNIIIPTYKQQRDPGLIPAGIVERLKKVGLWDLDPLNLFRITWHNEPVARGGGFGPVNYLDLPGTLTGVEARIIALVGKWFPTGAHKVGAAYSCLVPRLVTGQFDPTTQKAVWPSTGNYCRGGAYDAALLGCESIAILPEGMSTERFDWLATVAGEIIKTPGSESNVKEIFDKCHELRHSGQDLVIFNQFDEFGNYLWHHEVTGPAIQSVLEQALGPGDRLGGYVSATGSAGTLAAGDYLKKQSPRCKIAAVEALQCPTLLRNGFGEHRIEGIGDKHVPWIHNVKNTDLIIALDDETPMQLIRLFNEPEGRSFLAGRGVPDPLLASLDLIGISGAGNLAAAVKLAKYFELGPRDVVVTILTDSMEMYASRLAQMRRDQGDFTSCDAAAVHARHLQGLALDHIEELTYYGRKRVHNLKYFTWVEQQGKTYAEIQAQWEQEDYWERIPACAEQIDALIEAFNERTGLLKGQ
jgi:cysteine synthase A